MKSGKAWRVFFVALVLLLSTTSILYTLMVPKPSDIDFDFVRNHAPNHFGLESVSDPAGAQFASYFWKESFASVEAEVMAELLKKGWHKERKMPHEGHDVATFYNGKGAWVIMMKTGSPDGMLTLDPRYLKPNPDSVSIDIILPLPPGPWSKFRIWLFAVENKNSYVR